MKKRSLIARLWTWLTGETPEQYAATLSRADYYLCKEHIKQAAMLVRKMYCENYTVNIVCPNTECPNLTNTEMPMREYITNGAGSCPKCAAELSISPMKLITPNDERNT